MCPDGRFLGGIFVSIAQYLLHIEKGKCCKPQLHPDQWGECYDEDVSTSFDDVGWSNCRDDYFMVGIYKSDCQALYCLETFKCCKMKERTGRYLLLSEWLSNLMGKFDILADNDKKKLSLMFSLLDLRFVLNVRAQRIICFFLYCLQTRNVRKCDHMPYGDLPECQPLVTSRDMLRYEG